MRSVAFSSVPRVTADQMREVDRISVEELHLDLAQMMENAGRSLASLAMSMAAPAQVLVLAGPGGNGGGGLVAARHLVNRGVRVNVLLASDRAAPVTSHQLDIAKRMGIEIGNRPEGVDLVIDALIGYGLSGNPAGRFAELIDLCSILRSERTPVLALDNPSGLDVTSGKESEPCVHADATLTLALPKVGLGLSSAPGDLYMADISIPAGVYRRMGIEAGAYFRDGPVIRLVP